MANVDIKVASKPTFRNVAGKFEKANKELLENKRDMMRELGRLMVQYLQDEAPKKTGKFAQGIRFRSYVKGETVGFTTTSPQPLGGWITGGTRPHIIRAKHARALRFFWNKGPRGPGEYHFIYVHHPGTQPDDYPARAYQRWKPQAAESLRKISTRWAADVKGAS